MKNKASLKKTLNIVFNAIGWIFVAFAVVVTVLVFAAQNEDGVPTLGGKCVINILTSSMEPTLKSGDIIIGQTLTEEEKQNLQVRDEANGIEGDIVTFFTDLDGDGNNEINTHRIVGANYDENGNVISYITQGDNKDTNIVADSTALRWELVICKYTGTRFASVGTFMNFLQTSTGFFVVIVLPLAAIFIYELFKFVFTVRDAKGEKRGKITAEEEALIRQKAIEEYLREQAKHNTVTAEQPITSDAPSNDSGNADNTAQ